MEDPNDGPICNVCQEEFDDVDVGRIPRMLKCGHSICSTCLASLLARQPACPTCRTPCSQNQADIPRNFQLLDTIARQKTLRNDYEGVLLEKGRLATDLEKLESKYVELAEKEKERNREAVICGECKKQDSEADIQVCRTCSIEKFAWDIVNTVQNESGLELTSLAVCSTCAIRKHFKLNHDVQDFFPILAAHQYAIHVANLSLIRQDSKNLIALLKEEVEKLIDTINTGEKELDRMTDMIRRAKSTTIQQAFVTKIEKQIGKHTGYVEKLNDYVNEVTGDMKRMLTDLAAENQKIDETDCVADVDVSEPMIHFIKITNERIALENQTSEVE